MYYSGNSYYMLINYGLPLLGLIITFVAQCFVKSNYKKYRNYPVTKKITGKEVAKLILEKNNLSNIKINKISGELSDHYDPKNKSVNLSREIYEGDSIASIAVAAHECGHAIQDKVGYKFLKFRRSIIPLANFSSKFGYIIVVLGLIFNIIDLAKIGIIVLLGILLFQLVTLPVEFNASNRAKQELESLNLINNHEYSGVNSMLKSAAMTYVASLMTSLLQILRLALMVIGRDDN